MRQNHLRGACAVVKLESYQSPHEGVTHAFSVLVEVLVSPTEYDFFGRGDLTVDDMHYVNVTFGRANFQVETTPNAEIKLRIFDDVVSRVAAHPAIHLLLRRKGGEHAFAWRGEDALHAQR